MPGLHILTDNQAAQTYVATQLGIANGAGSGAGASVTVPVTFPYPGLPAEYCVMVTPSQPCFFGVTNKTSNGFSVVLTPQDSLTTLSAGTFDIAVLA
jgi:hypothetical protein